MRDGAHVFVQVYPPPESCCNKEKNDIISDELLAGIQMKVKLPEVVHRLGAFQFMLGKTAVGIERISGATKR